MNIKLQKSLAIFDLEATGLNVTHDRIVQIAVVKISPDGTITQRPIYPPLLREENLAEWVQQMEFLN